MTRLDHLLVERPPELRQSRSNPLFLLKIFSEPWSPGSSDLPPPLHICSGSW